MSRSRSNLDNIEQLIKSGKIGQASSQVKTIAGSRLSRPEKLKLANMARRIGHSELSLRLLNFFVRESKDASSVETCEYAIALIRAGFYSEGTELLNKVDIVRRGEAHFYLAFAHIYRWDYSQAATHLQKYLKLALPPYERLVAQVNLAASLIMTNESREKILSLLEEIIVQTKSMSAYRLRANALELKAQTYIANNEFTGAYKCLNEAEEFLDSNKEYDRLFIKKWKSLCDLKKHPNSVEARNGVLAVRSLAFKTGHWETARDCDYYLGIWHRNRSILTHLYFGTPHAAYKKRILDLGEGKIDTKSPYLWRLDSKKNPDIFLDLKTGKDKAGKPTFDPRRQSSKLLECLSSDFYRPIRLADIASKLFPGEFYNPSSTQNRVHQALHRLRLELGGAKLPLTITEAQGFSLKTSSVFGILLHADGDTQDLLSRLGAAFGENFFSTTQAQALTEWPRRTLQAWLSEKVTSGEIERSGNGPSTKYLIKKS